MRRLYWYIFGRWCEAHERGYRSDLCGQCIEVRCRDYAVIDRSPEWTRSSGVWPLVREGE